MNNRTETPINKNSQLRKSVTLTNMKDESCPLCSSIDLKPHSVGSTPMIKCHNCGVVLTPTANRGQASSDYYEEAYSLTNTVRASTEMHRYFRYPEYVRLISEVSAHKPGPATWLDIGCDHGFFLDDTRRFGYTVIGVEPARAPREYARHIGLDVRHDISEVAEPIDVASLWHVLEHLTDPIGVLTSVHRLMNSNGVLAIRVPDAGCFWSKALRDKWIWFQPHNHVVHYTLDILRDTVERAGFEVIMARSQYPNTYLTKLAYSLSTAVFETSGSLPSPSLRDRFARLYQDTTGKELYLIAKRK